MLTLLPIVSLSRQPGLLDRSIGCGGGAPHGSESDVLNSGPRTSDNSTGFHSFGFDRRVERQRATALLWCEGCILSKHVLSVPNLRVGGGWTTLKHVGLSVCAQLVLGSD